MTTEHSIPPLRDLPAGRLAARRQHLLAQIAAPAQPAPARRARRRLVLAAAILATLVAAAGVAIGSGSDWFLTTSAAQPLTRPMVVASGDAKGLAGTSSFKWDLKAFVATQPGSDGLKELCYALTAHPDPPDPDVIPGMACGPLSYPGPGHSSDPVNDTHWLTYVLAIQGETDSAKLKFIYGPTAASVASVDLVGAGHPPVSVPTVAAPGGLDLPVRFYVAALPNGELIQKLVPRDKDGNALEQWSLSIAQ